MSNENKLLGKQLKALRDYFQTIPTEVLILALDGGINLDQMAHEALANRGWSVKKNCQVGLGRAMDEYESHYNAD
ncbi:MAG: hypothetical protein BWK73_19180 [Thiothrix lacustris]|uniref:Uncharacterized protein n=1 Tax=Thiothrix lacustris TaxID=525917 RepID=A0A1Y1QPP7_9GAMM|nr:MAG: hypothetical protein BWK73_19180 [Thiothrix lacustris]